jgi:carboxymethylenebutenolidase
MDRMSGSLIEYRANGGTTPGYLTLPPSGRGAGIVVIQEWWGLVDHIKTVADRFAAAGYVALAPDLYHGKEAKSPDDAGRLLMALGIDRAATDIRAAADYLLGLDAVAPKAVGVVGFCMGGALALYAAAEHPDRFAAAVDLYGGHPKVTIDPEKLRVPVQGHFGRQDTHVPEADARALMDRLRQRGLVAEDYYYDAGHAFFNDARPQVYNAAAAALAWERILAFFGRYVAGGPARS